MVMAKVTNAPAFTDAGELIASARSAPCGEIGVIAFDGNDSRLLPTALVA
jgi:hypothetical protein